MKNSVYKSDRYFTLFDFKISHGRLLFRSQKSFDQKSNLDIVFYGVEYINVNTYLRGIEIKQTVLNDRLKSIRSLESFLTFDENRLFEISCNSDLYYVAASFFRVFENNLEFNESSIDLVSQNYIEVYSSLNR